MNPIITMTPVTGSSQIHAVGHNADTSVLAVRFKDKEGKPAGLYFYSAVTALEHAALMAAESLGKHLNSHIKPHKTCTKAENHEEEKTT